MIEARRESDPPPGEGNFDFPRMGNSGLTLESVPWQSGTLAFQFQKLTENERIAPELDSPFTPLGTSYQANIRVFQEQPPANPLNPTTPLTTNGSNPFDRGGIQFRGSEFAPAPFTTRIPSTDIPGSNRITW